TPELYTLSLHDALPISAALGMAGAPRAGEHLLVAVSGGPDSTALLAGLAALAPARALPVTAAHVDHGLRGREGAVECARVADLRSEEHTSELQSLAYLV